MGQPSASMQVGVCAKCQSIWPLDLLDAHGKCSQCRQRKHRNIPTVLHGIRFDSLKEAGRYQELLYRHNAGEIGPITCQPCFPIVVRGPQGEEIPIASYYADFSYEEKAGKIIIEDVKGPTTRKDKTYRLKKKLVEALYGIEIVEV